MSAVAGSLIFDTKTDTSGFNKGVDSLSKQTDGLSKSFVALGLTIASAFSVQKLKEFGSEALETASDLSEVQNVVDTTFKSSADVIDGFAKTALEKFGLSELSAKQFSSTIGAMFKSMGMGQNDILTMSQGITGLAGDMASFYNLDPEQAFEKLRAGISGETEPLKQLGINMSVANLQAFALSEGMKKSYESMTQAEQATLRYKYIMKATSDAQGDFSKTLDDSYANQKRVLNENISQLIGSIGELLLPAATKVAAALNEIVKAATSLIEAAKAGDILAIAILGIIAAITVLIGLIAAFIIKQLLANTITTLWTAISGGATAATTALGAAFTFLTGPIGLIILAVAAMIALIVLLVKHWDSIKKVAIAVWDAIKEAWKDAGKWFDKTFVQPVKDGINTMLKFVEGLVNGFISGINMMIDALNKLSFTVPDWVPGFGGEEFGFNITPIKKVSLPRLAEGGVIPPNSEFLAILGDQKRGMNIETPLQTMTDAFDKSFARNMGKLGGGGAATVILQIDGREFARVMAPYNAGETSRLGVRLTDR